MSTRFAGRVQISPRSTYAPIRYEATRPFARELARQYQLAFREGEAARHRFLNKRLIPLMQSMLVNPGPVQAESGSVQVFSHFLDGGRIIFDLSAALGDALAYTDIEAIPCGEVPIITPRCYLHFGRSPVAAAAGLQGAYVTAYEDRVCIDLADSGYATPHFASDDDEADRGEELLSVMFRLDDSGKPVQQAMEESVARTVENHRRMTEQMREFEARMQTEHGGMVSTPMTMGELDQHLPLLNLGLQLVVNSLFYLSVRPEDVEEGWPEDAPAELRRTAGDPAAKAGTRRTAENTLVNAGYIKIRYVGRQYSASTEGTEFAESLASGRVMPTHIRRGHFRRQPYGPDRALRKTILIAPVVVNPHRAGESPGRIYVAQPPA